MFFLLQYYKFLWYNPMQQNLIIPYHFSTKVLFIYVIVINTTFSGFTQTININSIDVPFTSKKKQDRKRRPQIASMSSQIFVHKRPEILTLISNGIVSLHGRVTIKFITQTETLLKAKGSTINNYTWTTDINHNSRTYGHPIRWRQYHDIWTDLSSLECNMVWDFFPKLMYLALSMCKFCFFAERLL